MKARSTMRIVKVFLACVLMFGVAAVVGWGVTHTTLPRETKPFATAPTVIRGFVPSGTAYTQTQNPYRPPTRPPVPAQAARADTPQSQPTYDGPIVNSPGWRSTWQSTASSQPTGTGQSGYPSIAPTMVTRYEPDPENPGQLKGVVEQVYPSIQPQQVLDESTQQIARLLHELRQTPAAPPSSGKLHTLHKLVAEQFDNRHRSQVSRLERVQADVQRTQELLARRLEQRDEIIARRVTQLLGEQDPLQWDYQPAMPVYPASNQYSGTIISPSMSSLPPSLPSFPNPQTAYPQVYVAPKSSAGLVPTANQTVPGQSQWTLPPNPPNDNVATAPRSPDVDVLGSLVRRIQQSQKILEASAGLDDTVADFSRPNPSKVKEQLAQAEAELKFHSDRLNRSAELKKLDLADAQKQFEAANIEAQNSQKLFRQKVISEDEQRLPQLKADVAKNAVKRAEIELSEIDQQLQWLNSIELKSSVQSPLYDVTPASSDDAETNSDLNSSTPNDGPAPPSTDGEVPENTPPLETSM